MRTLLLTLTMIVSLNCQAGAFLNYKNALAPSTSDRPTLTKKEFITIWESDVIACVKDGSKVIGINKSFATNKISKRRCSPKGAAFVRDVLKKRMVVLYAEQIASTGLISIK